VQKQGLLVSPFTPQYILGLRRHEKTALGVARGISCRWPRPVRTHKSPIACGSLQPIILTRGKAVLRRSSNKSSLIRTPSKGRQRLFPIHSLADDNSDHGLPLTAGVVRCTCGFFCGSLRVRESRIISRQTMIST
jgi:hypothetical protein